MITTKKVEEAKQRLKALWFGDPQNVIPFVTSTDENQIMEAKVGSPLLDPWLKELKPRAPVKDLFDIAMEVFIAEMKYDVRGNAVTYNIYDIKDDIPSLSWGNSITVNYKRKQLQIGGPKTPLHMWAQKQVIQQLSLNDLCRFQSSLQDPFVLQIAGKLAHVSRIQTNVKLANVLIIEHIASDDEVLRAILYSSSEEIQCLKGGLELRIDQDFKKEAAAKAFIKSKNFADPIRIQIEEIYKVAASDGVLDMYDAKLRAATFEQEEKEIGNELTKVTEQMVFAAQQFEY